MTADTGEIRPPSKPLLWDRMFSTKKYYPEIHKNTASFSKSWVKVQIRPHQSDC